MTPQKPTGEIAEQNKSGIFSFLYLFDEQWFFCNALKLPSVLIEKTTSSSARQLVRTPSVLPTGQEGSAPANYSSGNGRKLRCSCCSLEATVPQSVFSYSAPKYISETQRAARTEAPARRCANPHLILCWEARNRKTLQYKKWRSLGDLETMELQGFRDLGFVFDETEGLFRCIRGRKEEEEEDGGMKSSYLPAAWLTRRSAPPMVLGLGFWSGEEMKEQLRFWARAVAFTVRQDC
ncbi:uncharacterized protein LOC110034698 [Phalaenopsis equestris]|uniref:uncharacterized protein LOC110034698 n=1 Tax=Phalaenopsis equestris TaxID=78828 RepID=UPI0009E21C0B|nr:uncharacterized protein LOC110034698 [Phalaenopsis equestris]